MGEDVGSRSPLASTPTTSSNESPTVGRVFRKATNPTPVIAGTKKRLLDTLEQTFKTKLPCIVVSVSLPTTSEPCKALCNIFNVFYLISATNPSKRNKLYEANEDILLPKTTCYRRYVFILYLPMLLPIHFPLLHA